MPILGSAPAQGESQGTYGLGSEEIILGIPSNQLERMDKLQQQLSLPSRAAVISTALSLLEFILTLTSQKPTESLELIDSEKNFRGRIRLK